MKEKCKSLELNSLVAALNNVGCPIAGSQESSDAITESMRQMPD